MYVCVYISSLATHSRSMDPRAEYVHNNTENHTYRPCPGADPSPEHVEVSAGVM